MEYRRVARNVDCRCHGNDDDKSDVYFCRLVRPGRWEVTISWAPVLVRGVEQF